MSLRYDVCQLCCIDAVKCLQEMYVVTTAAQYGGLPCPTADGNTRRILPCTNNNPCPVNCTYSWDPVGNCTGACSNGTGVQPEQLTITSAALYGGWCPGTNGVSTSACLTYSTHQGPASSAFLLCCLFFSCLCLSGHDLATSILAALPWPPSV